MRILVDNGEYSLVNKGDVAMMQVVVRRLRDALPSAELGLITADSGLARIYLPDVATVGAFDGGRWTGGAQGLLGRLPSRLALAERETIDRLERIARSAGRPVKRALLRARGAERPREASNPPEAPWPPEALDVADFVLAAGGGYLTDVDEPQATRTLSLLREASLRGIPYALVGQGLGPLTSPKLVDLAREALPRAELVALREGVAGPPLLASLGVPESKIVVTGDDAIELAYNLRQDAVGAGIGVNLRVVPYSGLARSDVTEIRHAVQAVAERFDAPLVPVHISEFEDEDRRGTARLTTGYSRTVGDHRRFDQPSAVIRRVARCRVVVTGTYHAAVFALSQGIPAIGLPNSEYYTAKFEGLAEQFGDGCMVVPLEEPRVSARLRSALETAWEQASLFRDPLLESARRQVGLGRRTLHGVVDAIDPGLMRAGTRR